MYSEFFNKEDALLLKNYLVKFLCGFLPKHETQVKAKLEEFFENFFAKQDKLYGVDGEIASQNFSVLKKITEKGVLEDDFHLIDVLSSHYKDTFYTSVGQCIMLFLTNFSKELDMQWGESMHRIMTWLKSGPPSLSSSETIDFIVSAELQEFVEKTENTSNYMLFYYDIPDQWNFIAQITPSLNGVLKILLEQKDAESLALLTEDMLDKEAYNHESIDLFNQVLKLLIENKARENAFSLAIKMIENQAYHKESLNLFNAIYKLRTITAEEIRVLKKIDTFIKNTFPNIDETVEKLQAWITCAKVEQKKILQDQIHLFFGLAAEELRERHPVGDISFQLFDEFLADTKVEALWGDRYYSHRLTPILILQDTGAKVYSAWVAIHARPKPPTKPIFNSNEVHSPESNHFKPTPSEPESMELTSSTTSSGIAAETRVCTSSPERLVSFSAPANDALSQDKSFCDSRALEA